MTIENYEKMVRIGVVVPMVSNVCFLAAFDQISNRHSISPKTYESYDKLFTRAEQLGVGNRHSFVQEWREVEERALSELGVVTSRNALCARAKTPEDLTKTLKEKAGWRISVAIRDDHMLGLRPNGDGTYETLSTWTPFKDNLCVTPDEIAKQLDQPRRMSTAKHNRRVTHAVPNVLILPAG